MVDNKNLISSCKTKTLIFNLILLLVVFKSILWLWRNILSPTCLVDIFSSQSIRTNVYIEQWPIIHFLFVFLVVFLD